MAEQNIKMNVKTDTGYDTLYPQTKADIVSFNKSGSNLGATNVDSAIKEVNTKVDGRIEKTKILETLNEIELTEEKGFVPDAMVIKEILLKQNISSGDLSQVKLIPGRTVNIRRTNINAGTYLVAGSVLIQNLSNQDLSEDSSLVLLLVIEDREGRKEMEAQTCFISKHSEMSTFAQIIGVIDVPYDNSVISLQGQLSPFAPQDRLTAINTHRVSYLKFYKLPTK